MLIESFRLFQTFVSVIFAVCDPSEKFDFFLAFRKLCLELLDTFFPGSFCLSAFLLNFLTKITFSKFFFQLLVCF